MRRYLGPFRLGLILIALASLSGQARADLEDEFTVGDWYGYAYYNAQSEFGACSVATDQLVDTSVSLSLYEGSYIIALINLGWQLDAGDSHPMTLRVDNRLTRRLEAIASNPEMSQIPLGRDLEAIEALRGGRLLLLEMPGRTFRIDLAGSSAAIAALHDCVDRHTRPAAVSEAPPVPPGPTADGASSDPFSQPDARQPAPVPTNPFAPAPGDTADTPRSAEAARPPDDPPRPSDGGPTGIRPRPPVDGLQRIVPYVSFEGFALLVEMFLPGDPQASATPEHPLSDYAFEGQSDAGRYQGYYLEAALRGASTEELLDYLMWIDETVCDGPTRSTNRQVSHIGDRTIARETMKCLGDGHALTRTKVISGTQVHAQIAVIDGQAIALEAADAMFRMMSGLARNR